MKNSDSKTADAERDDTAMSVEEVQTALAEIERPLSDPHRPPLYGRLQNTLHDKHMAIFRAVHDGDAARVGQLLNEHERWYKKALEYSVRQWTRERQFAHLDYGVIPEGIFSPPLGIAPGSYDHDASREQLRRELGLDEEPPE